MDKVPLQIILKGWISKTVLYNFPKRPLSSSITISSNFLNNGAGVFNLVPGFNSLGFHCVLVMPLYFNTVCSPRASRTVSVNDVPKSEFSFPKKPCNFSQVNGRKGANKIFSESMAFRAVNMVRAAKSLSDFNRLPGRHLVQVLVDRTRQAERFLQGCTQFHRIEQIAHICEADFDPGK